jgi:uncharacterized membrane protein YphA (DoxX/SURF4 family)
MTALQATAVLFDATVPAVAFLLARLLFGGVLAFMGLNHFQNTDGMVPYAEAKGVPAAGLMVPLTGALLVAGGASIVLGAFPLLGAAAVALFLLVSTPLMHDFWAAPEDQQQDELTAFLKNTVMLGGALVFLALSSVAWPYALGLGL